MNKDEEIFILIPAYNEEAKIGIVILNLQTEGYNNILVINDGSKDNTEKVAKDAGAEVLNHIINRGQGAALRTGIEYLRENKQVDIIITFDADGQHQAKDIPAIIEPLNEGFDVTLGSRFLDKKTIVPKIKKIILKAGVVFTNTVSNIKLTDTHNGFRALGRNAIDRINLTQRGMEHASEIIDEIIKNKLKYKEVPVEVMYTKYSIAKGQSVADFLELGFKFLINKLTE